MFDSLVKVKEFCEKNAVKMADFMTIDIFKQLPHPVEFEMYFDL